MNLIFKQIFQLILLGQSDFPLGRMNIDINDVGIHIHVDNSQRISSFLQKALVSIQDGFIQSVFLYHAPVQKDMHAIAGSTVDKRPDDASCHMIIIIFKIHRDGIFRRPSSKHLVYDFLQRTAAAGTEALSSFMIQTESDVRPSQGKCLYQRLDETAFIGGGTHVFQTRRRFIEKTFHRNLCALGCRGIFIHFLFTIGHHNLCPVTAVTCQHRQSADRGNGRQRFPAETHGMNIPEITFLMNLAGGMALKRHPCIRMIHTDAVVFYADPGKTALLHRNDDSCGSGIHGIFHQFLHHTSWSFNDFTCRYHIGGLCIKFLYSAHNCKYYIICLCES